MYYKTILSSGPEPGADSPPGEISTCSLQQPCPKTPTNKLPALVMVRAPKVSNWIGFESRGEASKISPFRVSKVCLKAECTLALRRTDPVTLG